MINNSPILNVSAIESYVPSVDVLPPNQSLNEKINVIKSSSITFLPYGDKPQLKKRISAFQSGLRKKIQQAKNTERKEIFTAYVNAVEKVGIGDSSPPDEKCIGLWKILKKIQHRVSKLPVDVSACNSELLELMRQALKHKEYSALRHDESHPAIRMIHGLCLASYAEPRVLHAFHEIGASLHSRLSETEKQAPFHKRMKHMRDTGYLYGLIKKIISLEYIILYFNKLFNSVIGSRFIGKVAKVFGFKFDPRGYENNTGALYDEKIQVANDKPVVMRTIYTPSPTVGDEVSLEAKGILQAMENRRLMSKEDLAKDPYPYVMWCYTNLQNISSLDEGPRSRAIMHLNEEFPHVFRGITMAVNSPFYTASVHGSSERHIQAAIHDSDPIDEQYKQQQIDELEASANFTLQHRRKNQGGGYYFPPSTLNNGFQKGCHDVVERAYQLVIQEKKPETIPQDEWNWYQKAAFRELVLLGIVKWQQHAVAQEVGNSGGKILATNACKENIDRGGKFNAVMLWGLGGNEEDVLSALHARALLTEKSRLILPERLEPMYALILVVSQEKVKTFLLETVV